MPKNSMVQVLAMAGRIQRYNEAAQSGDIDNRHAKAFENLDKLAIQIADKADVIKRGFKEDGHKAGEAWTSEQVKSISADFSKIKDLLKSNKTAFAGVTTGSSNYADFGMERLFSEIVNFERNEKSGGLRPDGRPPSAQVLGAPLSS